MKNLIFKLLTLSLFIVITSCRTDKSINDTMSGQTGIVNKKPYIFQKGNLKFIATDLPNSGRSNLINRNIKVFSTTKIKF